MNKFIIIIVTFLLQIYATNAQQDFSNPILKGCCPEAKARLDSIINNAPYIFEGRMIKRNFNGQTQFYQAEDGTYYLSYILEVDKVYRGSEILKGGTVEVITKAKDGYGVSGFGDDMWNVLMCKKSDILGTSKDTDNRITLELFYDMPNEYSSYIYGGLYSKVKPDGTFREWNPSYFGLGGLNFRTKRGVRNFFKGYGLKPQKPKSNSQKK